MLPCLPVKDELNHSLQCSYCCSVAKLCLTLCHPWTAARQASLSFTVSRSLLRFMPIESHPLSPPSPPAFNLSQHQGLSHESVLCIRWLEYWSFSFSISPSNEYSGLISFGMDWLDLLAVQGTLKSLLQRHSSKALIIRPSAFFCLSCMENWWRRSFKTRSQGVSLVVQWLRIHLAMQGSPVRALIRKYPTHCGHLSLCIITTSARAPRACTLQQENHHDEKPTHSNEE